MNTKISIKKLFLYLFIFYGMLGIYYNLTFADDDVLAGRKQFSNYKNGKNPSEHLVWQPNPTFGVFELKHTDESGQITQWYEHFVDTNGREVVEIIRKTTSPNLKPPYESIQLISSFSYNKDGNVSEEWEFSGDGRLLRHVVYGYNSAGKWLQGDVYDASGKLIGQELTPPEAHLYGKQKAESP